MKFEHTYDNKMMHSCSYLFHDVNLWVNYWLCFEVKKAYVFKMVLFIFFMQIESCCFWVSSCWLMILKALHSYTSYSILHMLHIHIKYSIFHIFMHFWKTFVQAFWWGMWISHYQRIRCFYFYELVVSLFSIINILPKLSLLVIELVEHIICFDSCL
jgi:hypothetical protein